MLYGKHIYVEIHIITKKNGANVYFLKKLTMHGYHGICSNILPKLVVVKLFKEYLC